ncbi:MAG: hypothetical protein Q9221_007875 [Calogaya cf. arnoldii]
MHTDYYTGDGQWEVYTRNLNACCVIQRHPVDKANGNGPFGHSMGPTEPDVTYVVCGYRSGQVELDPPFWAVEFEVLQVCKNRARADEVREEHRQKILLEDRVGMWAKVVGVEVD